jgi:putative zinc finger protein
MTGEMGCERMRELAPEFALGIAEGEERDAALRHLSGCSGCRQLVSELSSVGDELLQLAPTHDPPAGFESRVLAVLAEPPRRGRRQPFDHRWRWVATAAAAVVLAAALGAGSVLLATAGDRRLAAGYQAVLSQGQGAYFLAAPLQGTQGRVGTVFGYQGQPSWVMVTLQPSIQEEGRFQAQAVTRDGRYLPLGDAVLGGAKETWGGQLPVDLSAVHELRFVGSDGRPTFAATFDTANPWD